MEPGPAVMLGDACLQEQDPEAALDDGGGPVEQPGLVIRDPPEQGLGEGLQNRGEVEGVPEGVHPSLDDHEPDGPASDVLP
ncbi:MAG: hypothetical protein CMA54_04570 [Euryarchaeota archaeon]|nr:hypothetical protein [Euryarchaeota archaeon]